MRCFYTFIIRIYAVLIHFTALFLPKARLWVQGRRGWSQTLEQEVSSSTTPIIWMHCASLGEYEQGKPLLAALKQDYPQHRLLLTFFSPSGYEVRKRNAIADIVCYLPMDTSQNAKRFLDICRPALAIFVKYEFWYNYLHCLHTFAVPIVFVSTIFRPQQYFFKGYAQWFRAHLKKVNHFFVQNEDSLNLLKSIGIHNASMVGDTRFDSVLTIAKQQQKNSIVESFKADKKLLLAGSSWPADEDYLLKLAQTFPYFKILIAPHEIHASHIKAIVQLFDTIPTTQYSQAKVESLSTSRVLILDTMGMLSSLYQYADYTWIGGGFGKGIHNTLEAAVFGMPIFFGPRYHKFDEAKALVKLRVAYPIKTVEEAVAIIQKFENNASDCEKINQKAQAYVAQNKGSVGLIMNYIHTTHLLT